MARMFLLDWKSRTEIAGVCRLAARRVLPLCGIVAAVAVVLPSQQILLGKSQLNGLIGSETYFDPATPIAVQQHIPWAYSNLGASPGERIIFNIAAQQGDTDRRGPSPTGPWTNFRGVGPYAMTFTSSADGEFDNAGSGMTTKTVNALSSGNVDFFIKGTWTGANPVTVTVRIVDNVPAPTAPDKGSAKDPDVVNDSAGTAMTWTFRQRMRVPTGMAQDNPAAPFNQWRANPAVYNYIMNPLVDPPGRPDYNGETVLETFAPPTAAFAMTDLQDWWKKAHPTITTPNQAAAVMFVSGQNGTFVIDNTDHISDRHSGFGETDPFTAAALTAGVGYNLPQTYSVGGNAIGNYTIGRQIVNGTVSIRKTGP